MWKVTYNLKNIFLLCVMHSEKYTIRKLCVKADIWSQKHLWHSNSAIKIQKKNVYGG